jgi:site-specific recombinase XerD
MMTPETFSILVQRFFGHLRSERSMSDHTICAYRDSFRLFLRYLSEQRHLRPEKVTFEAFSPETILGFLGHIEAARGNTIRTRNSRLTAIRAFVRFALSQGIPEFLLVGQRILNIPIKCASKPLLGFMDSQEIDSVLSTINLSSWSGRRDHLLFTLLFNTGGRISEVLKVRPEDIHRRIVRLHGKGRKDREVPIWPQTEKAIRGWCKHDRPASAQYLITSAKGTALSRRAAALRLRLAISGACDRCPSLKNKRITLHTWRHSTAMSLLKAGVPAEMIALWLGHEQLTTTHGYIEADLTMKQQCLDKLRKPVARQARRHRSSHLLEFLQAL